MNIGKGERARELLMQEVEALFVLTPEQRDRVEYISIEATSDKTDAWTYLRFYDECLVDAEVSGQPLSANNYLDQNGNPDGGHIDGPGLQIRWQRGPVETDPESGEVMGNGCFLVTLLNAAKYQLEFYQGTKFACPANQRALEHVETAMDILNQRQVDRFVRGARGKHKVTDLEDDNS